MKTMTRRTLKFCVEQSRTAELNDNLVWISIWVVMTISLLTFFFTQGHFDCSKLEVKRVTQSHFTSFFTDTPRIETKELLVTSPFPLSKLVKADPPHHQACQARRQSSTYTLNTHNPSICSTHSFTEWLLAKMRAQTCTCAAGRADKDRDVAVHSHDVRWWLGGQDKCCQLHCELLTQHRAADRI